MPEQRASAQPGHPEEEQLERFLRGESDRRERRAVIRHLLTGCGTCTAVTRTVWSLADRPRTRRLDAEDHLGA